MLMKEKIKNNINKIYKIACCVITIGIVLSFNSQNVKLSTEIVKANSNPSKNLNVKVMNKVVDGFKAEEDANAIAESVAESTAEEEAKKAEEARQAQIAAEKQAAEAEASRIIASSPQTVQELQSYAHDLVVYSYGWTEADFSALVNLWNRESGWRVNAGNSSSGAYGIPQALPGSKMASEGADWATNGETQIRWGLKYIAGRYGSPSNAWSNFLSKGWY